MRCPKAARGHGFFGGLDLAADPSRAVRLLDRSERPGSRPPVEAGIAGDRSAESVESAEIAEIASAAEKVQINALHQFAL